LVSKAAPTLRLELYFTDTPVQTSRNVDLTFLCFLTDLLLCSRCLRRGLRRRVSQAISPRHRPRSLCRDCAALVPGAPQRAARCAIPLDADRFHGSPSAPR
jgi:hypothetical protein